MKCAIYRCVVCSETRRYGYAAPERLAYEPEMRCESCRRPTRHSFVRLEGSPGVGQ